MQYTLSGVLSTPLSAPIAGPKGTADISDRMFDCEETLERTFRELVARAERAGWDTIEITLSLQAANAVTDRQIAQAIKTL